MATMEGPLSKWTNVMKGWQYRWFVLDDNAGLLSYYTSKEKMVRGARRGCVRLKGAVIGIDDEDDSTFTITVDGKVFHFQARDAEEREKWVKGLEETILRHSNSRLFTASERHKWDLLPTSIQDFDRRLLEADAYLQILIEQLKSLDQRIDSTPAEEQEHLQLIQVREKATAMLEAIKHSIVLLQIAKNTTHPINGLYQPFNSNSSKLQTPSSPKPGLKEVARVVKEVQVETAPVPGFSQSVPETSYSSSDDEDFFDASEDAVQVPSSVVVPPVRKATMDRQEKQKPNSDINYDAIYEEDSEDDMGSLETHGSVISHLLSQVKIGMDLTKVVLPTFILERRSLLEMYADFFAHPDEFIRISDFSNPRDRMVQCVRWYLSAFHAGRKSSVAKKPYNPILGELFRCHWDVPGQDLTGDPLNDSPVHWAHSNNLTFVAEQVSHHPPISAFYAEHQGKGISCEAHIWTKSKFLGLSIGVQNVGQAIVRLKNYPGEEYILNFPSGYGRSIITVPWIELGGRVEINCPQTGYSSHIEFLTKPFYGGKKHRVQGQVFQPQDKKAFLQLTGEWNGRIDAKWSSGAQEVFVDTQTLPIIRKLVRPISEQETYESRRLWKEVTAALKYRNVEAATSAKYALEQKQRNEAKQRTLNNEKWTNRLFHEEGDQWVFNQRH